MRILCSLPRKSCAVAFIVALFALLISNGTASAAWVSLGGPEGAGVEVRLLESTPDRIVVDYTLGGFESEEVTIDGKAYYRISLPEEPIFLEVGLPELPHVARSVIIPDGSRMRLTVLEAQVEEFEGMAVVPSKGNLLRTVDPETVPYEFSSFYGSARNYPAEYGEAGEPYIMRDYRGMVIDARPFQAVGDGRLRVASYLRLALEAVGPDLSNAIDRVEPPASVVTEFGEIYAQHFLNYGGERYAPVGERGTMLVICYDAFMDAMAPFVEWKNQMGIPTTIVPISAVPGGNTSTAIKNYIQGLYTPDGLAFVLLVGDGAQIATPTAAGGSSDPSYSLLVGSDRYPELFVGRFSAEQVAHVQTQVARSLTYEKTPMVGGAWYQKGMGVASNQGPGDDGEYDNQHMDVIRGKLLGYGYTEVDRIYDPTGTAAQVAAALNNGRGIINYCGHGSTTSWGSTGFSNSHVAALQNDWMLPFITSVACVNGQFNGYTCFAEAWLRSTRNGNPIGAIGTYMSSINQSWNPPMCGEDEVNDLLVNDEMRTMGGLFFNGSCQMMDEYGNSAGGDMFLTWHIFGDPSLMVRTKTPQAMTAQHSGTIRIGDTSYTVSIPGVANALCALYANGVLYGSAYTDAGGTAVVPINPPPANPMDLTLTVTAYNKIPVIVTVPVMPGLPDLLIESVTVLDGTRGDGDGLCDAGESIDLHVVLRNVGGVTATGVTAAISSGDPCLGVIVGNVPYANIPVDGTGACQEPYEVTFEINATDQHIVPVALAIHSNEGDWNAGFDLVVQAPVLKVQRSLVDDTVGGNGTGVADPGDSCFVSFEIKNTGHSGVGDLTGTLVCTDPSVGIIDGDGVAGALAEGVAGLFGTLQIVIDPECAAPRAIPCQIELAGENGFAAVLDYLIDISAWVDEAELDRGWTLGAHGDPATGGVWVREDPVGTTLYGNPVQSENDHTADPGSLCFVTGNGLPGGSPYLSDIDGGRTTLLSPVFDLSDAISATMRYWRWFYVNAGPGAEADDFWSVEVTSDGTNWVELEKIYASELPWTEKLYHIQDYVPLTNQVQFRFVASDEGRDTLVEAALDDFSLAALRVPAADVPGSDIAVRTELIGARPNPFNPKTAILYSVGAPSPVTIGVYDVSGRLVRTLVDGSVAAGQHAVSFDGRDNTGNAVPSGIYFVRMETPKAREIRQIALLK